MNDKNLKFQRWNDWYDKRHKLGKYKEKEMTLIHVPSVQEIEETLRTREIEKEIYEECESYEKDLYEDDMINSPSHYNVGNIETIDYLESLNLAEDFCCGNAIKYLSRYKHKNSPLEDLKKAQWYVNRLIQILEKREDSK